jgi:hypothetical protein
MTAYNVPRISVVYATTRTTSDKEIAVERRADRPLALKKAQFITLQSNRE